MKWVFGIIAIGALVYLVELAHRILQVIIAVTEGQDAQFRYLRDELQEANRKLDELEPVARRFKPDPFDRY